MSKQLNLFAPHKNSLEAYYEIKNSGAKMSRTQSIIGLLTDEKERTDRDIMIALGFTDMNAVRPRITEMIKDPDCHIIEECGDTIDPVTHKKVRIVRIMSDIK